MKKRIISMLLTVLMVMSLFSGLTVSADAATYNGANTIDYTMAQGDFVLRICQKLGLNYYTCKPAIMALNNIQDGQWNKLTVGRTLTLPASDYDALLISNGAGTTVYNSGAAATTATTSNVTGTATTGTATTVNPTTAAASADTLAYYLVPYTMSYGETVSGVCNALGVNFAIFSPFIKQVNNVSNWTRVRAGDTLIIPTPVAPAVGTTCYGVMQHMVASSDTAYGITASKGVNYSANERLLKVLNQTENLAAIKAGDKFFYPVPLTVSVPGTGNPGSTVTTTTTNTVTDGNGTTTTSTTTTAKLYKLTGGMSASDGTMLFYVNNQAVTAAPAGAKVTVVTDTYAGKAIQSLTVKHADGTADLRLSGDTFIMPGCDVRVDVAIASGYDINITSNYSGKATASVNGVSVQAAVKGAAVVIKSVDPNYEVSAVYASYSKMLSASNKTVLAVSTANAFIMPAAAVDVEVVLKPVSTHAFYVNDPVRGSFYLEVNGSPVTRAAKGAKVTVVAKGNDGYEPTSLTVTRHMPDGSVGESINTFSNSFTMPGYDVDVTVTFGAKGNNILMMPTQLGVVRAFDANKGGSTGLKAAATADKDADITEAETGKTVMLRAFNVDDSGEIGDELSSDSYTIVYDVERNSDGLKVKLETKTVESKDYQVFEMPKGGVTVSASITTKDTAKVKGLIYLNDSEDAVTTYSDCNFTVTYKNASNKDTRVEFNGKKNTTLYMIPTLQYVDIRSNAADGITLDRYEISVYKDGDTTNELKELSEILTNEANSRGYFQIPEEAKIGVDVKKATLVIKAYFETGKVGINPAVISAGNGTVSFFTRPAFDMPMDFNDLPGAILATLGTSVNSAAPGETVYVLAAPAVGYQFDDSRYESRLKVTRQDNGAALQLTKVGPLYDTRTGGIWAYQYSFTMPAAGVDIDCAFDAKPFRLYMKCVDQTGKDISGLGLWQIAVNMVPGIVDNSMFAEAVGTVVEVAYGDYVTVAMTEAGWSKYDMVSFRVDGKEYTDDELNHFYNFQMIDERAKDLEIVAVMKPRVPYTVSIHNLYAYNYDVTKGGVEFVILDSPTGYSDKERFNSAGALNYVHNAITGDKVGIVVNTLNGKYTVKPENITITAYLQDADRIIPQETWIDAYGNQVEPNSANALHVFTFTMPDSDAYVGVNFEGVKQGLQISVVDENDQPVSGMVRLFANNIYRDVGADQSFDDVAYNTPVQIVRSELALAQNKKIEKVDVRTWYGNSVTYTDASAAGEGITFMMPDSRTIVYIKLGTIGSDLPTVVIDTRVTNGTLVFKKDPSVNAPSANLSDFNVGDTVYIYGVPNDGYDNLEIGDLKVYVNGMNNSANLTPIIVDKDGKVLTGTGNNGSLLWQFKLPAGAVIFEAAFEPHEAATRNIKLVIDGQTDGKVKATIGGYTGSYGNGTILQAVEGSTITFAPETSSAITRIISKSGKGLNGNAYTVPSGLTADSAGNWDEVTITLPAKAHENASVTIKSDQNVIISSAAVSGSFKNAEGTTFTLPVGSTLTITSYTTGLDKVNLSSASGQGVSNNVYTVPDVESDTLTITLSSSANAINATIGEHGEVQFFTDAAMTTPLTSTSVAKDTTVYMKVLPNAGYVNNKLTVKGVVSNASVLDGNKFVMPEGGVFVEATFAPKSLEIPVTFYKGDTKVTDATIKIKINDKEITYSNDSSKIAAATEMKLAILPNTVTGKYSLDSVKVYYGAADKDGTKLGSTNYTVTGTETEMRFILKDGTGNTTTTTTQTSGSSGRNITFYAAPPEAEVSENGNETSENGQTENNGGTDETPEVNNSTVNEATGNDAQNNTGSGADEVTEEGVPEEVEETNG